MNREKSRLTLLAVAGGYLAFTGGGLIYEVINEQPDNAMLFWGIGLFFIVVGGYVLVTKGRDVFKMRKEEASSLQEEVVELEDDKKDLEEVTEKEK